MVNCLKPVNKEWWAWGLGASLKNTCVWNPKAIFSKTELFVSIAAAKYQILHYSVKRYWELFKYASAHCKRDDFAGLEKMAETRSLPF